MDLLGLNIFDEKVAWFSPTVSRDIQNVWVY